MKFTKIALATSLIVGASLANANDIEFGIQGGYSSGGDTLGVLLDAGDGTSIGIFAIKPLTEDGLALKVAANYIYNSGNSASSFIRFPIDVLAVKQMNKLQLAAGVTYHLSPNVIFQDTSENVTTTRSGNSTTTTTTTTTEQKTVDFDNALGLVLEANYKLNDTLNLGLRYTNIEYSVANSEDTTTKYDGSSFSVIAGYTF